MKSSPIKYGTRFGCRWGMPHDFTGVKETRRFKVEICKLCRKKMRYGKGLHQKIDNVQYLKDHVRSYAQENGSTKRVFAKLYKPEKLIIRL